MEVLKIKLATIAEVKELIDSEIPHNKICKNLKELLQKQYDTAAKLDKFYQKCKREKPTNTEVDTIRETLKGFRINMDKKKRLVKDLFAKSMEIKKRIDTFYYKSKPDAESVDQFYKDLNDEPVLFESSLSDLKKVSEKCQKLIRKSKEVKKGSKDVTKLIKYYKKLNVTCVEFENIIKEKKADGDFTEKLEKEMEKIDEMDLEKLLTIDAQIE